MKNLNFEEAKEICKQNGYILRKGRPDARYNKGYKYTLYYIQNDNVYAVKKTLKEAVITATSNPNPTFLENS